MAKLQLHVHDIQTCTHYTSVSQKITLSVHFAKKYIICILCTLRISCISQNAHYMYVSQTCASIYITHGRARKQLELVQAMHHTSPIIQHPHNYTSQHVKRCLCLAYRVKWNGCPSSQPLELLHVAWEVGFVQLPHLLQ